MKIFDLYETKEVKIEDEGLKPVINIDEKLVLKTRGRHTERFGKLKMNIIERLALLIAVPGHRGKKHKIQTSWASGKYNKNMKVVLESLKIIQEKTGKNPVQVLVRAIENSAPRDEITTIEYGGAKYPQAVDVSPLRRVSLALKNLVRGSYDKSFRKKTKIEQALAGEILKAYENSNESFAAKKKDETEKQADSAR
ncbi:MAG: 30S ribosomal protein S7 [Nanoarchaeota archaeon]|nr:30S ribosomal protein S7 [Nanoarchaeota archaeon]MBU1136641.1 30S ribosomal protein S7 [Nanoarchaeota archaeon]